MKDREPKQFPLLPGIDVLFGGQREVPITLPSGKRGTALDDTPRIVRFCGATSSRYFREQPAGIWTEIEDDEALNAAADFESAEVSKRAPKEG
jgi:hypothetical protein